jgi:Zn-dependent M16 (insulinase) family peptidase
MLRSLTTWLHDGDPLAPLAWEAPLASIKQRLAAGEPVFETALRRWFLDNRHRAVVLLVPDTELAAGKAVAEQAELDRLRDSLSPGERRELARLTERLREVQRRPDTPEALATIPCLSPDDMPRTNKLLPGEDRMAGDVSVFVHDLDTSGVAYADVLFSLDRTPGDLVPLLPLFGRALTEMGTRRRDYVALGLELAAHTGGMEAGPLFTDVFDEPEASAWLHVRGKATRDKAGRLFDLMAEILVEPDLTDPERFLRMALEERARLEQSLVPGGHAVVSARLRARYSQAGHLGELTGGISYLQSLRALTDRLEREPGAVLEDLRSLHRLILHRGNMLVNLTADQPLLEACLPLAGSLGNRLPESPGDGERRRLSPPVLPEGEALLVPAQVNYVGQGANLFEVGYIWHGSAHVISRHLRMAWLWDQVRVQGGAYGVFCGLDRLSGAWTQVSYRDPNIGRTLEAYDGAAAWLRNLKPDRRELDKAIVGAIGDLDAYLLPDAKGLTSLTRRLARNTDERRQRLREEILGTTVADFRRFAQALDATSGRRAVVVLGGEQARQQAQERGWRQVPVL